jgi:LmbE family N-acetylglucosaminyl deacetylase
MNWPADGETSIEALKQLLWGEPDPALRVAVLAAHPDDETIGASTLLARLPGTQIIYLTDGAPRNRNLWPPNMHGSREEYAEVRGHEAASALAHVGVSRGQLHWMGAVDQEAVLNVRGLSRQLSELLAQLGTNLLITHPYEGGHPDHDCAALVARLALPRLQGAGVPSLCEMTSYHARDGRCVTGEFLNPDAPTEIVCELRAEDRERKRHMMDEYKSQRLVLENFPIVSERLRTAPEYDFTKPPHEGKLWYEHMGWTTGQRWRDLATRTLAQAQECSCD